MHGNAGDRNYEQSEEEDEDGEYADDDDADDADDDDAADDDDEDDDGGDDDFVSTVPTVTWMDRSESVVTVVFRIYTYI